MRTRALLGIAGLLLNSAFALGADPQSAAMAVQTTLLGDVGQVPFKKFMVSPDQSRLAWIQRVGNQVAMFIDGVAGQPFDFIEGRQPVFSPDGSRVMYVGRVGMQHTLVLDGKATQQYLEIHDAQFSSDSKHVLYVARTSMEEEVLLLDGVPQGPGHYFYIKTPMFSPDGKTVVFDAMKERTTDKSVLVRNGVEGPIGGEITDICFSADSKHVLAIRHNDLDSSVILDEKIGPIFRRIGSPIINSDGSHYFVETQQDNQWVAVIDGKPQKGLPFMMRFTFAPSGARYMSLYVVTPDMSKGMLAVIDGKEFGPVANLGPAVFSPDGARLAFSLTRTANGPMTMWIDGVEQKSYPGVGSAIFSPDSKRLAYAAHLQEALVGSAVMVLDGAPQPMFDSVDDPTFSQDSRRFAYRARHQSPRQDRRFIVVDGVEQPGHDSVSMPVFSLDSKHCAYIAIDNDKSCIVIDGAETQKVAGRFLDESHSGPVLDGPGRLHFLVRKGDAISRVTATIPVAK